jgi:ribosome-associated protein
VRVVLPITLGQFVKVAGMAATGGDAKTMVTSGMVRLNGVVETRRGKKLAFGDVVTAGGNGGSGRRTRLMCCPTGDSHELPGADAS